MLGEEILDPHHTESGLDSTKGLGFLAMRTTFAEEKLTRQVEADCHDLHFMDSTISATGMAGYEIHMGHTDFTGEVMHPFTVKRDADSQSVPEGLVSKDGLVFGTYIHGVFDHDGFRRGILNAIRKRKGLAPLESSRNLRAEKQRNYERLAAIVKENLNMDLLRSIMGEREC